jgi:hypothetical protein
MGDKISGLTELGQGVLASGDWFIVTDVSDLTDGASGTSKKIDADNILDTLITAFGKTIIDDADAAAVMTTLGISAFAQTLVDDASAAALLTTIGLDNDLLTLALPASLTISAFGKTIVDDADAASVRTTIGAGTDWTYGSQIATTSGTTVELITTIGASATEVEVLLLGVSHNAANQALLVQIGGTSGYKTTGYTSVGGTIAAGGAEETGIATGFLVGDETLNDASYTNNGVVKLTRWDTAENIWISSGIVAVSTTLINFNAGQVDLGEALEDIRLTTSGGSATFNAGEARVRWR